MGPAMQWMTAGSGIIHQRVILPAEMHCFPPWVSVSSALKMTAPRCQEVKAADIPVLKEDDGTHVRVVCGNFWGTTGPVDGIAADPVCFDVSVPPGRRIFRSGRPIARSPTSSLDRASSVTLRTRLAAPTEGVGWAETGRPSAAENRSLRSV